MSVRPKFKGTLFVPTPETVFKLIAPFETEIQYTGYAKNMHFTEECMEMLGLKLIKSSGTPYPCYGQQKVTGMSATCSIFSIPVGSMFKIKIDKMWNQNKNRYSRYPTLLFTTALNKNGPIKGGIVVKRLVNMPEVEEI